MTHFFPTSTRIFRFCFFFAWLWSNIFYLCCPNFKYTRIKFILLFHNILLLSFHHWDLVWWQVEVFRFSSLKVLVAQVCPTLCDPMDCSPPGSSVYGILQARRLESVVMCFSRGSSHTRDQTCISCITGRFFTVWATREAQLNVLGGPLSFILTCFKMRIESTLHYFFETYNCYVWPDIWPTFKNVPGVLKKKVYSPIVGHMF